MAAEINHCNPFLVDGLRAARVLMLLGGLAHKAVVRALGLRQKDYRFAHAAEHELPHGRTMIDSYHCSRYNMNTGRLTPAMFAEAFARARGGVDGDWSAAAAMRFLS